MFQEGLVDAIGGAMPVPLSSSAKADELLILDMHDGVTLEYFDIPLHTFSALVSAPSPGAYYNHQIRRAFRFKQRA